jgi:hypothetical protein
MNADHCFSGPRIIRFTHLANLKSLGPAHEDINLLAIMVSQNLNQKVPRNSFFSKNLT